MDAAPVLMKRKESEAPELWMDDGGGPPGFPVSSRATKIRRLDAEVPPVAPGAGVPQPQPVAALDVEEVPMCGDVVVPVDVAPAANDERAIVLYRPAEAARNLLLGPLRPGVPLRVSSDWIHGLKNTMLQEASSHRALYEGLAGDESSNLAMVPWAASHSQAASTDATVTGTMDAEDSEGTSMEVEQDRADQLSTAGPAQGEELHRGQWPQHCMVQQPLPAASYQPSPVTWSW